MQITVVGGGKVGFTLASQLEKEGHDIAIIDNRLKIIEKCDDQLDVLCIHGNGANVNTLKEGNIEEADMMIAVTGSDEVNLICCMLAKKLGVKNTIARVRNPEYVNSIELLKDELGLSMSINPERGAAREIVRSLHFSQGVHVSTFAKGRVEIAEIIVGEDSSLSNTKVRTIGSRHHGHVLICAVNRGKEVIIPDGEFVIQKGDRISVIGTTQHIESFLITTGISEYRNFNEIMIVGGGRITYYLASMMLGMNIRVKIIEKNPDKCRQLALQFPEANVILGDGTDQEFLLSENLTAMDAFVALTDNDEENVIISMFAASQGVGRVMPKINRMSLEFLLKKFDMINSVSPKYITANRIVRYVRAMQNAVGSNIESLITLNDNSVEALEFRVRKNCKFIGVPLKNLTFKPGILIGYISHNGHPEIANGNSSLQLDDTIVVVSSISKLRDLNDVLA